MCSLVVGIRRYAAIVRDAQDGPISMTSRNIINEYNQFMLTLGEIISQIKDFLEHEDQQLHFNLNLRNRLIDILDEICEQNFKIQPGKARKQIIEVDMSQSIKKKETSPRETLKLDQVPEEVKKAAEEYKMPYDPKIRSDSESDFDNMFDDDQEEKPMRSEIDAVSFKPKSDQHSGDDSESSDDVFTRKHQPVREKDKPELIRGIPKMFGNSKKNRD